MSANANLHQSRKDPSASGDLTDLQNAGNGRGHNPLGHGTNYGSTEDDNNSNTIMASCYYDQLPHMEDVVIRPKLENMNSEDIAEGGDDDDGYEEYEGGAEDGEIATGGKKNRICPFCQKIFDAHSALKRHLRIHTKEKPFNITKVGRASSAMPGNLEFSLV